MLAMQVPDTARRQQELKASLPVLRAEIARLNAPQTFVQCAKAERKLLIMERELERLAEVEAAATKHPALRLPSLLSILLGLYISWTLLRGLPLNGSLELPAIGWPVLRTALSKPGGPWRAGRCVCDI
ncbi:hypothetical protein ACKKBG_A28185 [Auxenochlorella protothecoides x Auxenochlorella symbiontica]